MLNKKVTIYIPAYNTDSINQSIESVLEQSIKFDEIIKQNRLGDHI